MKTILSPPSRFGVGKFALGLLLAFILGAALTYKLSRPEPLSPAQFIEARQGLRSLPTANPTPEPTPMSEVDQGSAIPTPVPGVMELNPLATMAQLNELNAAELDARLRFANILISQNPDNYLALKAKMFILLTMELKYGAQVPIEDYVDLYNNLLRFTGVNTKDELMQTARALDPNAETIAPAELEGIDAELIHLPFLRYSALRDLESLATIAEDYIATFPQSYIGYLYLSEAMWRDGDTANAALVLREGFRHITNPDLMITFLRQIQRDPMNRIFTMGETGN